MFDTLCKDGLTHEALELCSHIKEKDQMPDVVGYTSVIEEYAKAGGQSKEALKVFMRMLGVGVAPNVYTYSVLIKGLAGDAKIGNAKKYLLEMMGKGMMPNAGTYCAVLEAMVREQRVEEGRELVEQMKTKGLVVDEKAVRSVLSSEAVSIFSLGSSEQQC
ncbi:Pentatricopeptide repeat-containing protein At4g38150 [Linum grandiflorum]